MGQLEAGRPGSRQVVTVVMSSIRYGLKKNVWSVTLATETGRNEANAKKRPSRTKRVGCLLNLEAYIQQQHSESPVKAKVC